MERATSMTGPQPDHAWPHQAGPCGSPLSGPRGGRPRRWLPSGTDVAPPRWRFPDSMSLASLPVDIRKPEGIRPKLIVGEHPWACRWRRDLHSLQALAQRSGPFNRHRRNFELAPQLPQRPESGARSMWGAEWHFGPEYGLQAGEALLERHGARARLPDVVQEPPRRLFNPVEPGRAGKTEDRHDPSRGVHSDHSGADDFCMRRTKSTSSQHEVRPSQQRPAMAL